MKEGLKLFLFGIPPGYVVKEGDDKEQRPRLPDTASFNEHPVSDKDFESIEERLVLWFDLLSPEQTDCTLDDVSSGTGIGKTALNEFFRTYLAMDFRTWKTEYRIKRICRIMDDDPKSKANPLARRFGFTDLSNFHRQFKKTTGMTPLSWKNRF